MKLNRKQRRTLNAITKKLSSWCRAKIRILIAAPTNGGKTYEMIVNYANKYRDTHVPIFISLNSNDSVYQDVTTFEEHGWTPIVKGEGNFITDNWDCYVGTTNAAWSDRVQAASNYAKSLHGKNRLILLDEVDLMCFFLPDYDKQKKHIIEALLNSLDEDDIVIGASSSITQLVNTDFQWTEVQILHPYKAGYRCMIDYFEGSNIHKRQIISGTSMEALKHGKTLTEEIRYWADQTDMRHKLGIKVTGFVEPRDQGNYLANITALLEDAGYPTYTLKGEKDRVPLDTDTKYLLALIINLGIPANRAMVLMRLYYYIWDVPKLLDMCAQQQRMNNYFDDDRDSWIITTQEGSDRIDEANKIQTWLYESAHIWACMPYETKKVWITENFPYYSLIDLFSVGKSGELEETIQHMEPVWILDFTPGDILDAEKQGYPCIDDFGYTTGTEGTYARALIPKINQNAWEAPSRYDPNVIGGRTLVPFGDPKNKKAGNITITLSIGPPPPKGCQAYIEGDKIKLYLFDQNHNQTGLKKLGLKNGR